MLDLKEARGRLVQGKKKFTIGMAIGVAAGMVLYRILFG